MIPSIDRDEILQAMDRFDAELRDSPDWQGWESNGSYQYALLHGDRRYPVKKVISLATGQPVSEFSGGDEANRFARGRGFEIASLTRGVDGLQQRLNEILSEYNSPDRGPFGKANPLWRSFTATANILQQTTAVTERASIVVKPSVGQGNWARVPWIALMDERETTSTQHGVYVVFLFREDMSGVYLTFNQGVTQLFSERSSGDARKELRTRAQTYRTYCEHLENQGFQLDNDIDLRTRGQLGRQYQDSTIAHRFYAADSLPSDTELLEDLQSVLTAYDRYLDAKGDEKSVASLNGSEPVPDFDRSTTAQELVDQIGSYGFQFEPWQVATFLAAARTKPFVILAGVSGTGKTKLPELVARATGARSTVIPVKPDWTDSADLLGYTDLRDEYRPGELLRFVKDAINDGDRQAIAVIDEMNLARVEYYFAEVLSRMEDDPGILGQRRPLQPDAQDEWGAYPLPENLLLVGTVNMDESTHGFSKKVLDRAFTLEFSRINLSTWQPTTISPRPATTWPASAWQPRARRLGDLKDASETDHKTINEAIVELEVANEILQQAQLQVGYRVRDELALFNLHASELQEVFVDTDNERVAPLDVGLSMKLLPRISGGSSVVHQVLLGLLGWAYRSDGIPLTETGATTLVEEWTQAGATDVLADARLPRTAARLCLMWSRLEGEGFTSYWL